MKAAKGSIGAALDKPQSNIRFYLFHGADEAGSRALGERLLAGLGKAEKFAIAAGALKADPATLADEAGAMALFGGPRALWIEPAADEILAAVEAVLDAPAVESPAIAIAGALRKSSALLKLAESHPAALSHVSYVPEGRDADRMVIDLGRREGLRIAPDVAARIAEASANNQAIVTQEVVKYALYAGATAAAARELTHDIVDELGADSSEGNALRVGDMALAGELGALAEELGRMSPAGNEAIPIVRALQRRVLQLAPLRARIEQGERVDAVMTSAGKALFWKDKSMIQAMLSRWSAERLAQIGERVAALEEQLIFSSAPQTAALGEELTAIARAARRGS
jgi:DNA polymerase III subunit delta